MGRVNVAGQTRGIGGNREEGSASGDRSRDDKEIGPGAAEDGFLDAGQRPAIAGGSSRDARSREAPAPARLAAGKGRDEGAFGDRAQQCRALFVRADRRDESAGQHDAFDERLRGQDAPDLLGHDRDLDRTGAHTAVFFGEGKSEDAHLGEALPGVVLPPLPFVDDGAAGLRGVVGLRQESANGVAQCNLLGVECEVHVRVPGSCRQ